MTQLKLDDCLGNNIANWRDTTPPTPGEVIQAQQFRQSFPVAIPKPQTFTRSYNCHGLAFASRRTTIAVGIEELLQNDNYVGIAKGQVMAGDIAAYLLESGFGQEISHSAVVTRREGERVWVLSKWGGLEEYSHALEYCPYGHLPVTFYRKVF